tara:strand:+ start:5355 stop:5483 length:129 start_codon:yes stop_codon:yes gene_type:complete
MIAKLLVFVVLISPFFPYFFLEGILPLPDIDQKLKNHFPFPK